MADELTEAEIGDLKAVFEAIDTDGSGSLSISELNEALNHANGQMQATIESIMAGIDFDGDQELDYHEFLAATMKRNVFIREDKMLSAFQKLTGDGVDEINIDILTSICGSEEHAKEILAKVDLDGGGTIDYEEFKALMLEQIDK